MNDSADCRSHDDALRESEEKYRILVESSPFGVLIIQDGRLAFSNRALAEMIGVENPDDYIGKDALIFVSEKEKPRLRAFMEARTAGERDVPNRYQSSLTRADGSEFPIEILTSLITLKGKAAIQVIVIDMSETVRSEQAEKDARHYLETIVETSHDGIMVLNAEGEFEFFNAACINIFGWPEDELMGEPFMKVIPPDYHEFMTQRWDEAQRGEGTPYEADIVTKENERRHLMVSHRDMEVGGSRKYCVVLRDISERRRMEEEVRLAQKMQAVGQLAGGIAHDFNNLLTAIVGFGQLVSKSLDEAHSAQEDLAELLRAAHRAEDLTAQILAFSRKQVMHIATLDLNETILSVDKLLRQAIGPHVELAIEFGENLWPVEADEGCLEQVLLNLAVNARDAMPSGGTLSIVLDNLSVGPRAPALQEQVTQGDYVRIQVRDTGQGMEEEVVARIFEPFFTTKQKSKGSGLGLSTVYGIICQLGGHIAVHSQLDIGTTFTILLPRSHGSIDYRSADAPAELPQGGTEKILVVDDEASVRRVTARMLRELGYNVLEAASGAEAIELAEKTSEPIDLLLTDVVMPSMNGPALADRLGDFIGEFRSLFMSGFTDLQSDLTEEEAETLLRKPFDLNQLAQCVRAALDKELLE